jgi:CRISPR/Cas system CSM-associated protein Csm3 (group 7 of RAMP superfamily)
VNDALSLGEGLPRIEQRDGVALDPATRTAEDKKKYDYQLLAAGTEFELHFELLLEDEDAQRNPNAQRAQVANSKRLQALTLALQGLEDGEIRLGARKRRGFGCCTAKDWSVAHYQLHQRQDLLAWLAADHKDWLAGDTPEPVTGEKIAPLLAPIAPSLDTQLANDEREWFEIKAEFELNGSLMVRSGFEDFDEWAEQIIKDEEGNETKTEKLLKRRPDSVHLQTWNGAAHQPVLSGTSIAGALRQRALRIANTLKPDDAAKDFIDGLFGPRVIKGGEDLRASRLRVDETFIENSRSLIQTRIKIDRFTGGTIESALLEEEPLFGGTVKICARLMLTGDARNEAEIGLLLLLLKDLWLGDLPLGGESAIGRGRLRGQTATLRWQRRSQPLRELMLPSQPDATLVSKEDAAELERYVAAFNQWKQESAA